MVDTIINTLERQVNCINKTNFSISILRQCVKSRPKIFDVNAGLQKRVDLPNTRYSIILPFLTKFFLNSRVNETKSWYS